MTWVDVIEGGSLALGYCRTGRWHGGLLLTGPVGLVDGRRTWDLHTRLPNPEWEQEISLYFDDAIPEDFPDTVWTSLPGIARVAQEVVFAPTWRVGRDPLPDPVRGWLIREDASEWLAWYEAR